jgi:hypothetical protein
MTATFAGRRPAGLLVTTVIVELTALTAWIHIGLGGTLFTLNGLGYAALGIAYVVAATTPMPALQRLAWLPRMGLAAYALVTIGAYVVIGPYFALGWVTKGVELAIVGLVLAELLDAYGSPRRLVEAAVASVSPPRRQVES